MLAYRRRRKAGMRRGAYRRVCACKQARVAVFALVSRRGAAYSRPKFWRHRHDTLPSRALRRTAGLLGLGRVLTEELRGTGVRVGVLSAGAVETPLWDGVPSAPDRALMITPGQVADAALYMATLDTNAALEEMTLMPARGVL